MLNRNAIGVDVNDDALSLARGNTDFQSEYKPWIEIRKGDACDLSFIKSNSIHLICTHPPYANIIRYSEGIPGDLSQLDVSAFLSSMEYVSGEAFRVLRPGRICAFMIGDVRKHGRLYPLGFQTMEVFRKTGFVLKEIIIKEQHNCRSSDYWDGKERSFLLLAHEYVFVLQKAHQVSEGVLHEDFELDYDSEIIDPIIRNGVDAC